MNAADSVRLDAGAELFVTRHRHGTRVLHVEAAGVRTLVALTDVQAADLARLLTEGDG